MSEADRKAAKAAVGELIAAVPVVEPPLKAVLSFFDLRANELRLAAAHWQLRSVAQQ